MFSSLNTWLTKPATHFFYGEFCFLPEIVSQDKNQCGFTALGQRSSTKILKYSAHILSMTVTTQKQSNWNRLLMKRHVEEILKKLQSISLFAQPSISKSPSFSKCSIYSMKSAAGRYAVHKGVKNSFSGLVYFFPNVHFRSVILKEISLPHLQIAFKTVLANRFCNSLSMSDHQNIWDLLGFQGFF